LYRLAEELETMSIDELSAAMHRLADLGSECKTSGELMIAFAQEMKSRATRHVAD
jgi:hypothetical protein